MRVQTISLCLKAIEIVFCLNKIKVKILGGEEQKWQVKKY